MSDTLQPGTVIGGFEVASVLGRGGFGTTYKAVERDRQRTYAIKEYLPEDVSQRAANGFVSARSGHQDVYERGLVAFMTEADTLKRLPRRHGLVRVRAAFEKFGTAYCVMEFIEGDSLDVMASRMIRSNGFVPHELVVDLAVSVCWALDALHSENIVHRDVKPANIMLRRSGEPVLIDFGAARRLSRRERRETIFTRRYASLEQFPPEMTALGRVLEEGPRSDLYSLSVVLYELIAQNLPPDAPTRIKAKMQDGRDPYVPLAQALAGRAFAGRYPPELLQAIDAGCALMPSQRPATARIYAEAVSPGSWAKQKAAEQARKQSSDFTIMPTVKDGGVKPWVWVLALLIGLAVAFLAYEFYQTRFRVEIF